MAIKKTKAFDFLTILKCLKSQAELELRYPHLANKSLPIYFQGMELEFSSYRDYRVVKNK